MALSPLINCPVCSRELHIKAGLCPNCGSPATGTVSDEPVNKIPYPNKKVCPSCKIDKSETNSGLICHECGHS